MGAAVSVEVTSVVETDPPGSVVVEETVVVVAQLVVNRVAVATGDVKVTVTATGTWTTLSATPIAFPHEYCEQV